MINHSVPNFPKFLKPLLQANQLRQKREYRLALEIYHQVIGQFGETDVLDQTLAHCYFELGLYESDESGFKYAIVWMKKAIALTPENSQLHADLGQFHALGTLEYKEAANEYKVAIEIDPNNEKALVGGAALYGVPEEVVTLDEAINWLERVVRIAPNDPNYHFRLGMLYHEAGRLPEAEIELLKALLCARPLDPSPAQTINNVMSDKNA